MDSLNQIILFVKGALLLIASLLMNGCISHEELLNFNEGSEWSQQPGQPLTVPHIRIQTDDIIQIRVHSLDPETVTPFNLDQNISPSGNVVIEGDSDYLVDKKGNISFPVLGIIHLKGLTTIEAKDTLIKKLEIYLNEPIVNLRLKNFKISVLGEVKIPQTFRVEEEEINILEVLSRVGDFTNYANRRNVLVIRENDGQREYGRLNLHSRDIFQSPFFYLQQNDVVYVEPIKERTASISDKTNKILPWASIVITMTTLLVAVAK